MPHERKPIAQENRQASPIDGFTPQLDDSIAKVRPADRDIAPACRRGFP
jgi:hypothetical protein